MGHTELTCLRFKVVELDGEFDELRKLILKEKMSATLRNNLKHLESEQLKVFQFLFVSEKLRVYYSRNTSLFCTLADAMTVLPNQHLSAPVSISFLT